MSKINEAIHDIHFMDEMSERNIWLNRINPVVKLIVTLYYLVLVMSFNKYNLNGLLGMIIYPVVIVMLADIPAIKTLKKLKIVYGAIFLVGIVNPLLDRQVVNVVGNFQITSGMYSMITLFFKAGFAVFASFILIETTSIEDICYALQTLHMPKILVVLVLLIYRYIIMMLKETERITQAYSMRAPGQRGINFKVWGSLVGQMLLRSVDKAQIVYESMVMRGFNGDFYVKSSKSANGIIYLIVWVGILTLLRVFPLFEIVGNILV